MLDDQPHRIGFVGIIFPTLGVANALQLPLMFGLIENGKVGGLKVYAEHS